MSLKKLIILFIFTFCALSIVSCSSSTNSENSNTNNQYIEDNQTEVNLLNSIKIPDNYEYELDEDEEGTVIYLYKKDDIELNNGVISISSFNRINLPPEEQIEYYCNVFDEDKDVLAYTYEIKTNMNGLKCLCFFLEFSDYYDYICYVLTDKRDISIETIYYSSDSEIINVSQEVIDGILN